jgi:hypothetical protein
MYRKDVCMASKTVVLMFLSGKGLQFDLEEEKLKIFIEALEKGTDVFINLSNYMTSLHKDIERMPFNRNGLAWYEVRNISKIAVPEKKIIQG